MDAACKDLREEFNKEERMEEEKEDQDDEDRISIEDRESEIGEKKKTFTREELEAEIAKRGVASLSFKFDKLCNALAEGEEEKRRKGGMESYMLSNSTTNAIISGSPR